MTKEKVNLTEIDYDLLVENSLRQVVVQVLNITQKNGLIGDHHFYITFATKYQGVQIPKKLLDSYPEEMTIVIQHQFSDLIVEKNSFSITLYFSSIAHRLIVPFEAITYFADPHAKFGLRFNLDGEEYNPVPVPTDSADTNPDGEIVPPPDTSAKVVALDAFRKK